MSKEEQILDMAKNLCKIRSKYRDDDFCGRCHGEKSDYIGCIAGMPILFDAGYRKADEVRRETAGEIIEKLRCCRAALKDCFDTAFDGVLCKLATDYVLDGKSSHENHVPILCPAPIMTNRDWLNSLSNEELAELIYPLPEMRKAFVDWLEMTQKEDKVTPKLPDIGDTVYSICMKIGENEMYYYIDAEDVTSEADRHRFYADILEEKTYLSFENADKRLKDLMEEDKK